VLSFLNQERKNKWDSPESVFFFRTAEASGQPFHCSSGKESDA